MLARWAWIATEFASVRFALNDGAMTRLSAMPVEATDVFA